MGGEEITSDILHNKNCYQYLLSISSKIPAFTAAALPNHLSEPLSVLQSESVYQSTFPYSELYTQLITHLETEINVLFIQQRSEFLSQLKACDSTKPHNTLFSSELSKANLISNLHALDDFIFAIYNSDNGVLDQTFETIKEIALEHRPIGSTIKSSITKKLADKGKRINPLSPSPADEGSVYNRLQTLGSSNFKPQYKTNLPTKRNYAYMDETQATEIRIGTQAQLHQGEVRVSPLFELFLHAQYRRNQQPSDKILHIYFNNLGKDRKGFEGNKESSFTETLHELEIRHPNIAVITLPADKGLMKRKIFKQTEKKLSYEKIYNVFLQIASQDPAARIKTKDFYISDKVRNKLFVDGTEKDVLIGLLNKSFCCLGITPGSELSPAQAQAVWFHFIKFELTNYIIEVLQPEMINFSCKDAIDRGGAASAYYNLMKSIEKGIPLTREEFEKGLHAAPAMVKGRGMNHHLNLIWNAIDAYINANYEHLMSDPALFCLIQWRDSNCPHARIAGLLKSRMDECRAELTNFKTGSAELREKIDKGIEIIAKARKLAESGASGKRLLLETVTCTNQLIFNPQQTTSAHYITLADELTIKYPKLQIIAGLMKALAGIICYLPSMKNSKQWIKSGLALARGGFYAHTRNDLQNKMREQSICLALDETESISTTVI